MRLTGFLTGNQIETVHRNALRVLDEVGVSVEHAAVRERLTAIGGRCESDGSRVFFSPKIVEDLIRSVPKATDANDEPHVSIGSGIYQSFYLDPDINELLPFDEERLARYIGFARSLLGTSSVGMLGVPFIPEGISPHLLPLAERLYAWKYGANPGGGVLSTDLCEPILEMCRCHAERSDKRLEEVFTAGGYLISPLRLARPECEQLVFFADRGLRMYIGHLPSQGGTTPVSMAGALTLALAEQLFLFLLRRAFWDDATLHLEAMISTIDMRSGAFCYGRPEQQRLTLAMADIARYYGCRCWGHTGCSDAKLPSVEAGVQKAIGALSTALATGHGFIEAGLLGTDEICSPIQMVLDHDIATSLNTLLANPLVDDLECAFDEIASAGTDGNHFGTDFTVERFRDSLFHPQTWSAKSVNGWLASGMRIDIDKARDTVAEFEACYAESSMISEEEERELRDIILKIR